VLITEVPESYRAYDLKDKVILEVDGVEINNIEDAKNEFAKITRYGRTIITMINEKGERERIIFQ
jgi:hypothetical protein